MGLIAHWARQLYDATGINLSILYDAFDRQEFFHGFLVTLELTLACAVVSTLIGVAAAWAQQSRVGPVRRVMGGYVHFFRNTPPLVQLYFFYFGVGAILKAGVIPLIPAFSLGSISWAIVALSLCAGAFNAEIFRSGIEAVPASTLEAADAMGFDRRYVFLHVVLPLAVRICLPAYTNNIINLAKQTTLAYAIAVPELLYASSQIYAVEFNVVTMMNVLLISYILIVSVIAVALRWVERRLALPGFGACA